MNIILLITIATNINNKGLEYMLILFDIYSFQYLVSDTNVEIERMIIRNIDTNFPIAYVTSDGGVCISGMIPIYCPTIAITIIANMITGSYT